MFPYNEIIHCKSYIPLCDYEYTGQNNLPPGVVHVDLDSIPEFFDKIRHTKNYYVVVSSCSDWSACLQEQFPPWNDVSKAANLFVNNNSGYEPVYIGPRVTDKCSPRDMYSVKCHSFTSKTFPSIPPNVVKWFTTNLCLNDSRVEGIPFGVNNVNLDNIATTELAAFVPVWQKIDRIYVNFQFYTGERAELYNLSRNRPDICFSERDVDFKTYIKNMSESTFTLAPAGNGLDCFRMCESLYCGVIPIVNQSLSNIVYRNISMQLTSLSSIFDLFNIETLRQFRPAPFDPVKEPRLYISHWAEKIRQYRCRL